VKPAVRVNASPGSIFTADDLLPTSAGGLGIAVCYFQSISPALTASASVWPVERTTSVFSPGLSV